MASGHALLLGVTPEIADIVWEPPLQLLAVDQSAAMIDGIWPGDNPRRRARIGDWLTLEPSIEAQAQAQAQAQAHVRGFDLIVGDGVLSLFEYPAGYAVLAAALARLLRPGGLFAVRLFCRVEPSETVSDVMQALWAGRIANFHAFKWRLAMALQGDGTRGVRLADIWSSFVEQAGSVRALADRTGFPEPEVGTIEGYRGVQDRYSFSTEREVVELLAPDFDLLESWRGSYELGERCPHLTFRRRG
jgi:SAM-dependent methyltransferase